MKATISLIVQVVTLSTAILVYVLRVEARLVALEVKVDRVLATLNNGGKQ